MSNTMNQETNLSLKRKPQSGLVSRLALYYYRLQNTVKSKRYTVKPVKQIRV
jgi:hypothetical protein